VQGNDGKARVRVRAGELPEHPPEKSNGSGDDRAITLDTIVELRRAYAERTAELLARVEKTEEKADHWRSEAEQIRSDAGHHRAMAELLREQIAREVARVERLEDEMRELRRPWWRKVFGP
jgi:hypothetical protein